MIISTMIDMIAVEMIMVDELRADRNLMIRRI